MTRVDVAGGAAHHLRVAGHHAVHGVPVHRQLSHGGGQPDQRHARRRRAAPVDSDVVDPPDRALQVVEDPELHRMIGFGVARGRPAVDDRGGEHARMLAAAVLDDRRGRFASTHRDAVRVRVERQRRRVAQVVIGETDAGKDLRDRDDVLGAPVVTGAHGRQEPVVEVEPGADHARGLQRLQRRAGIDHDVGVAGRPLNRTVAAESDDDAVVDALLEPAALRDCDRHEPRRPRQDAGQIPVAHFCARRSFAARQNTVGADVGEVALDHLVTVAELAEDRLGHRRRGEGEDRADGTEQGRSAEGRRTPAPDGPPSCGP